MVMKVMNHKSIGCTSNLPTPSLVAATSMFRTGSPSSFRVRSLPRQRLGRRSMRLGELDRGRRAIDGDRRNSATRWVHPGDMKVSMAMGDP